MTAGRCFTSNLHSFCSALSAGGSAKSAGRYITEVAASLVSTTVPHSFMERVSVSQPFEMYARMGLRPRAVLVSSEWAEGMGNAAARQKIAAQNFSARRRGNKRADRNKEEA